MVFSIVICTWGKAAEVIGRLFVSAYSGVVVSPVRKAFKHSCCPEFVSADMAFPESFRAALSFHCCLATH